MYFVTAFGGRARFGEVLCVAGSGLEGGVEERLLGIWGGSDGSGGGCWLIWSCSVGMPEVAMWGL